MKASWWLMYLDTDEFIMTGEDGGDSVKTPRCIQDQVETWHSSWPGTDQLSMTMRHVAQDNIVASDHLTLPEQAGMSSGRLTWISVKPIFTPARLANVRDAHGNYYALKHHQKYSTSARLIDGTPVTCIRFSELSSASQVDCATLLLRQLQHIRGQKAYWARRHEEASLLPRLG